jgi:hypothetical protein
MKIHVRKAEGRLNGDVLALPRLVLDPALVVAASLGADGTVTVDLITQLTLTGRDADEAAKAIFGRQWPRRVRWVTT